MKREVRKSQLVSPHGVGAVIDINDEGFVAQDISEWEAPNCPQTTKKYFGKKPSSIRRWG